MSELSRRVGLVSGRPAAALPCHCMARRVPMPGMRASWWMLAMLLMLAQARAWAAGIEDLVILHKLTARTQELVAERRYVEAAKAAEEALRFTRTRFGPDDREYGACVFNLAQVYAQMGEFTRSEQLHILGYSGSPEGQGTRTMSAA